MASKALRRQARDEARLRYGPEESALRGLIKEAKATLRTTVAVEEGAARGIRSAVNAAKPEIRKAYESAGKTVAEVNSDLNRDLSMLSSAADPWKAVSAREAAGARRRLAEALSMAERDLEDRKVQAAQGAAFAKTNAVRQYGADLAKVQGRRQDLKREKGIFTAQTLRELSKEDRAYRLDVAEHRERRRANKADERAAAERNRIGREKNQISREKAAKEGKKKPKWTNEQRRSAGEQYERAVRLAQGESPKPGEGRELIAGLITTGGITSPLIAKAAAERAIYGGVSRKVARQMLSRYGVRVKVRKPRSQRIVDQYNRVSPLR